MGKLIIYLDQNYISNLAKARYLKDWADPNRSDYSRLFDLLIELTHQNKIICPASPFHQHESEKGERVKDIAWLVYDELSFGLSFISMVDFSQIEAAARDYVGLAQPSTPLWMIAFDQDPNFDVRPLIQPGEIMVNLQSPDWWIDLNKRTDDIVSDMYRSFKTFRKGLSKSFSEELHFQKTQILREVFLPPQLLAAWVPALDHRLVDFGGPFVEAHQLQVYGIISRSPNPHGFFQSKELLEHPYLHIRASLMAADIFYYPARIPEPSLTKDFEIVATVLPYVDVLATDSYIKELIKQTKLLKRYRVQVYSSKKADISKLESMLGRLK